MVIAGEDRSIAEIVVTVRASAWVSLILHYANRLQGQCRRELALILIKGEYAVEAREENCESKQWSARCCCVARQGL